MQNNIYKIFIFCISFFSGLYIFTSCESSKKATTAKPNFAKNVVVAHRGAWKKNNLPENSIASLREAINIGCTGSEFDVHLTADDSLIINHDPTYFNLPIEKTTYAELEKHRLSNGEKLPTLYEYITEGLKNNTTTRLVCEIKPSAISKERGQLVAEKVIRLVQKMKAEALVVYISFDVDILKKLIEIDPKVHTQYLNGNLQPDALLAAGISGLDYHQNVFKKQPGIIKEAQQKKLALNVWTVNNAEDMDWYLANDFDFITTNEPELLFERIKNGPLAKGQKLIWSDEFNENGLPDSSSWGYAVGGKGYGNNELQYYTKADTNNVFIKDGKLHIRALKQQKENNQYTSARLTSKGKINFTYGRIEVRAKLPAGRGTWPAIWMLGEKIDTMGWPAAGEIDIMEHVGYDPGVIHGTIHSKAYNHVKKTEKGKSIAIENVFDQFHNYAIEWTKEKIDFYVDDQLYNSFANEHLTNAEWPFDSPFFLILNVAVGGNWGGKKGVDDSVFPAVMEVDYVRVYQ